MKIKVKTPNPHFIGRRFIVDQNIFFMNGEAEFEGDQRHVSILKSMDYVVEVEQEKKANTKRQAKKEDK